MTQLIQWEETIQEPAPPPVKLKLTLVVEDGRGRRVRFATSTDVIHALEQDAETREVVVRYVTNSLISDSLRLAGEDDTEPPVDQQARIELAEAAVAEMKIETQRAWETVEAVAKALGCGASKVQILSALTQTLAATVRDTELIRKERDEARAEVERLQKETEKACRILYNTGATRGDLLTRAQRAVATHQESCAELAAHEETIARLELELAKAVKDRDKAEGDLHEVDNLLEGDWDVEQTRLDVIGAIRKERDEAHASLVDAKKRIDELEATISVIHEEVWSCDNRGSLTDVPKMIETVKRERDEARRRLDALDATKLLEARATTARLERELAEARAEMEKLKQRDPSRKEMEAALGDKDECFLHGTVRRCIHCKVPVFGGPTACQCCVRIIEEHQQRERG